MKTLGAGLILLACLAASLSYIREKKRRIAALRELHAALGLMAGELDARAAPLPELCRLLGERAAGEAGAFFTALGASLDRLGSRDFAQLWREAAEKTLQLPAGEEMEELKRLGDVLGRYALDEQLRAIRACRAALAAGLERAQAAYPGERRLGLGLPAAGGLLLIIALM